MINLHVHTNFSFDCISRIDKIIDFIKRDGQDHIAITDHGNMSGSVQFYKECKKAEIKPILGCLLKGQEIYTKNGIKNIEDIQVDDMVYSHTGKLQKVIGAMSRKFNGILYTIELANSQARSLKVTGEHPILISDSQGNKSWVKVEDINIERKYKNGGIKNHTSYVCCPKIKGITTHIDVNDLLPNYLLCVNNQIIKTIKLNKYDSLNKSWNNFKNKINLSKPFCYFWGLFISEGSFGHNNKNKLNGQCTLTFNTSEKNLVKFCKDFLENEFNIYPKIHDRPEKGSVDLVWCNIPFAYIFSKLIGVGSKNKYIHHAAFNMPLDLQEFLLEGILDGDCKHLSEKNNNKSQVLKVASRNFAWGFRQLIINQGYFARVSEKEYDGKICYIVPYQKYSKYQRSWHDEEYVYYPISKIHNEKIDTTVYNFHVENDNSYLSDYALHNCELYICKPGFEASDKSAANKTLNHLVVLAKNKTGYNNLLKMMEIGAENFYYRSRVDEKILFAHSEGLIVINGHMTTSIFETLFFNYNALYECKDLDCCRQYLYPDYEERFLSVANRYKDVFGDDFYIECQLFDQGDIGQQASGMILYELAKKHKFNAVGTGDSHYIEAKDAKFHKTFCAIKQNAKIRDLPNIGYFNSGTYGLITKDHAKKCYPKELIEATSEIASKIEDYDILHKEKIPTFAGVDNQQDELYKMCLERLKYLELGEEYYKRLEYEMSVIKDGDLAGYFLIMSDIIRWAESQDILVNVGRGSAGGSLVSMLSKITKIDPIKHKLLFERFYSPDRAKFGDIPDIDSDFPASRRDDVINYVKNKYGHDKVSGVVTFSTLQGKNAIKDVLRVFSACDFVQMNKITGLIPSRDKISDKLADFKKETDSDSIILYCLKEDPDLLRDYCVINDDGNLSGEYSDYFEIAIGLEGAIKSESKHASAIILSDKPIRDVAPLMRDKSSDDLLVSLDMDSFPSVGLLKLDILGLKNLDCLTEVNNLLEEIGLINE